MIINVKSRQQMSNRVKKSISILMSYAAGDILNVEFLVKYLYNNNGFELLA
jgi:hypothetical protein